MFRTSLLAGSLAVLTAALTLAAVTISATAQQEERRERATQQEAKEFTGLVVDLHHYLTNEGYALGEQEDAHVAGQHTGGPIALLTAEEGVIRTTTKLRIIMFASNDDANRLRSRVNEMVGKRVRINGREYSRHDVAAIATRSIAEIKEEQKPTRERSRQ